MDVIQCQQCGGIVVYEVEEEAARCLFCASVALQTSAVDDIIVDPDAAIEFDVDQTSADVAYRRWACSSWWYAKELRRLEVELQAMWLPAWRLDADVDTHWAGLKPAATKSGVRPVSGAESARCRTLVPASLGLRSDELSALAPFDEAAATDWNPAHARCPWEAPGLSEAAALRKARVLLGRQRARALRRTHGLTRCRVSIALARESQALLMLPIYIGSFRYRDRPWRFVINGQTGKVTGEAPLSRRKVALVTLAALLVLALVSALWGRRPPDPDPDPDPDPQCEPSASSARMSARCAE